MTCEHIGPIAPEDLATLAAHIADGLRPHVLGKLQFCLEQLFREQEQRPLAAMVPECSPKCTHITAAGARLLGPNRRLNTGSSVHSASSTSPRFPMPSETRTATHGSAGENLRMEVRSRSASKKSQSQCSVAPSARSHLRNLDSASNCPPEKHWLKLPWQYSDEAPPEPSGVRSLEEARDTELLSAVPDIEARYQQLPSRASSLSRFVPDDRKEEQLPTFRMDDKMPSLPGVVRTSILNQQFPPEDDQLDQALGPDEQGHAASADVMSTEVHAHGGLPNRHAAGSAAGESAGDAPAFPLTYEQCLMMLHSSGDLPNKPAVAGEGCSPRSAPKRCPQPKRSQDSWAAGASTGAALGMPLHALTHGAHKSGCSPRQRSSMPTASTQEDSREATVIPVMRQVTAQSISTLSSSVSMLSSCTLLDAIPAKGGHERASTCEWSMGLARPGFCGALDARAFASDTKAARLQQEQELPGGGGRLHEKPITSEQKGEMTKPGWRSSFSRRSLSSDRKAARLDWEEELISIGGRCRTTAQEWTGAVSTKLDMRRTLQARTFASDTTAMLLRKEEELAGENSKQSTHHRRSYRVQEQVASNQTKLGLLGGLLPKVSSSGTMTARLEREEELLGEMRLPRARHRQSEQIITPRWKEGEAKDGFILDEVPTLVEGNSSFLASSILCGGVAACAAAASRCVGQRVDSPLLLRLCGLLPCGRLWMVHRYVMQLLAASLVAIFVKQLYLEQKRIMSSTGCPWGVCMHFGHLSDLVLSMGSFLGILAMRKLASLRLLGSPTALLARFAIEHDVVWKWSSATLWNSLYLAVLWVGSLAFRAATMPPGTRRVDVLPACAFTLTSLIFVSLVFSILHVSCIICILIDSYAMRVSRSMDPIRSIREWDRLGALLRKVSRAVDHGFLLVQIAAMVMLLCSFTDLMLHGDRMIWQFLSNLLLAQSLILPVSRAAEATEMCTRLPSLINAMNFHGNDFSLERHYLVEHISYSAAGFYVGEIRLTAAIALRGTYVSIIIALGVLTKLTQLTFM